MTASYMLMVNDSNDKMDIGESALLLLFPHLRLSTSWKDRSIPVIKVEST